VKTIFPEVPTATPLLASLIDTPRMLALPTFVVVALVQVSTAAYASFGEKAEVSKNPITNNMIIGIFTHTHNHNNTKALVGKFSL
jgi:hypothetical protein